VNHIGHFENGLFKKDDRVLLNVDEARRELNTRLHSAGHILDMAVHRLGINWKPGKGYHFPDGAYIEYDGVIDENIDKEKLKQEIENKANEIIRKAIKTSLLFMSKEEMHKVCENVPDYIPEDKPSRVVMYGDFGVPCGGTHVANLAEVGHLTIRKISNKKGLIRVGYDIK